MLTAFALTLVLIGLGALSLVGIVVVGVLKLAFKLIGLALGMVLMLGGGVLTLGLAFGLGIALLVPLLPLLALIALIWLIARASRPAPRLAYIEAPRH
jgi:hypothetical protein